MRVQMLRAAIFNPVHDVSPDFGIRVAAAQKDGEKLTCVLIGEDGGNFPAGHPRFWQEREYCVANGSGLLRVYSEAPGVYVEYGYGSGLQFHGRAAPDRIIVYAGGAPVLDAQISIADAGQAESIPANRPGEPPVTLGPASMTSIDAQSGLASPEIQPVVVHATISPRGSLLESEVVAASAPALAPLALQVVKNSRFSPSERTQRELYILVRFEPAK